MIGLRRTVLLVAATLLLQAFVLYRAFHGGHLSGLVPWDDCQIILSGLYNLRVFAAAQSPLDLVAALRLVVVHSPVADLPTMLGLMVTGGAVWGPFALSGLPVLLALYAVLVRAGRAEAWLSAAIAACILLQPLTINALTFLKADWKSGVLTAAAVYLLYEAAQRSDRGLKLWGAGLLGVAVAAKLTAFYMPLFALVVLAAFELVGFAARRAGGETLSLAGHLRRERPTLSIAAALVLGPYLVFFLLGSLGHHGLIAYIAFALGDAWNDGLSLPQRAAFYGPFSGNAAWGGLPCQLLVFAGSALVVSIARRTWIFPLALLLMAGLALMFLAPLAVARTSNPEFGATLLGLVLGAALVAMGVFARAIPRFGGAAALALVLILTATASLGSPQIAAKDAPGAAVLRGLADTYRRILDEIVARSPERPPRLLVFYEHLFAPFPNLSTLYFQRTGELMDVDRIDGLAPAAPVLDRLARTDFVLTLVPVGPVPGLERRFPTSRDPAAADRFVAAQPRFAAVASFPIPGGRIVLYQARPAVETLASPRGNLITP